MTKVGCLILTVSLLTLEAHASSVVQVTFSELVNSSQFIFEGRVVDKRTDVDKRGVIHTYVTFEILDVTKGKYNNATIELRFLGGIVGDIAFEVSDMIIPAQGEHGMYFIESTTGFQANPLFGWEQGHFLVKRLPDGSERVFTAQGVAVSAVSSAPVKASGLSTGTVLGVQIASDASPSQMTLESFKKEIQQLLKAQQ